MRMRALYLYGSVITSLTLLSGCVFQGEQSLEEMDPPQTQSVNYVEELDQVSQEQTTEGIEEAQDEQDPITQTVERQLYLLDQNGLVVPKTVSLPKIESKEVALQSIEYLIKGGPVSQVLPNGFQAVLPAGTEVNSLNLKDDGTLFIDLSKEFSNYRPEDELKILQSITYTLTQFESVERIKLQINGYDQEVMPVNGTPISNGYSRANGINMYVGDISDITDSRAVMLYYPSQIGNEFYYVPVTKRMSIQKDNMYTAIVQALVEGPQFDLPLLNVFNMETKLMEQPEYEDGVLTLTFNEAILNHFEDHTISDEVMNTLVLSLTEQPGVEAISVQIENLDQVYNENGVEYSEPVYRPIMVNTGSF